MTDEELKELVASLAVSHKETEATVNKFAKETEAKVNKLSDNFDKIQKDMAKNNLETKELFQETDKKFQETDKKFQETDKKFQELRGDIKNLGKEIGALGRKFGGFTEGMAFPSMTKILEEQFGMEHIAPRVNKKNKEDGGWIELDVLGYANSEKNEAVVVEVKSKLRDGDVEKFKNTLSKFSTYFPEHKDKTLYAILAYVNFEKDELSRVLKEGIYQAQVSGDVFQLQTPAGFQPKKF